MLTHRSFLESTSAHSPSTHHHHHHHRHLHHHHHIDPRRGAGRGEQQLRNMAKEAAGMTEETEYMIDRQVSKEADTAAESSGDAKEMRAVILSGFGGLNKLRVSRKPMPEPQEGEVKIRVKAW